MSAIRVLGARRTRRILLTLLLLAGVGGTGVVAWDTHVMNGLIDLGWEAAYVGNPQAASLPGSGWTGNEHTELTHVVLKELGVDAVFGMEPVGTSNTTVVDLNGVFQPQVLAGEKQGDNMTTLLEERNVPPPAHFAGLPDYSFAMHDWINKNTHCPLDPATYAYADCHKFKGWMGNLNANHFGTQARNMYTRYHLLALNLAQRAKTMRLLLDLHPLEATAYADFVKEAELEALVYEAIGQHFLEDRWATGHMWERWNGADQETSALYPLAFMVAAAAGLMHGSEGVTKLPDPMGSPLVVTQGGDHAVPVQWRIPDLPPQPGVGDYRLEDMHDGNFGGEFGFSQMPIAVTDQKNRMIACSKAGWSEVIEAFGVTTPGHYGKHDVTLTQTSFPPILDEDNDCWNAWATNEAMRQGWEAHPATENIRLEARTLQQIAETQGVAELRERLLPHVEVTWRVASRVALDDPDGIFLARGGIGSFNVDPQGLGVTSGDVKVGKGFRVPTYAEPQNLDGLLTVDPQGRGRDKHALYGFFNRSHADWWCQNLQTELATLRGSPGLIRREACSYIANRAYKGTDPAYKGARVEKREFMNQESDPICRYYGVETASLNESIPYFLHPGYVATPESQTVAAHGYDSVGTGASRSRSSTAWSAPARHPPTATPNGMWWRGHSRTGARSRSGPQLRQHARHAQDRRSRGRLPVHSTDRELERHPDPVHGHRGSTHRRRLVPPGLSLHGHEPLQRRPLHPPRRRRRPDVPAQLVRLGRGGLDPHRRGVVQLRRRRRQPGRLPPHRQLGGGPHVHLRARLVRGQSVDAQRRNALVRRQHARHRRLRLQQPDRGLRQRPHHRRWHVGASGPASRQSHRRGRRQSAEDQWTTF